MDNSRLTKQVYLWDRSCNEATALSSWISDVKSVLYSCGLDSIYDSVGGGVKSKLTLISAKAEAYASSLGLVELHGHICI